MADAPLPLVILPGLDGAAELRAGLAERLARTRPVISLSYAHDPALGYAALDGYVRARLPEGRFVLVGESFSGPVAIKLAHDEPQRVAGLVLASTFARHPWPRWMAAFAPYLDARLTPEAVLDWVMLGPKATARQRALFHKAVADLPRDVMRARAREALSIDVSGLLAATACPVLCIVGQSDWLIQRRCWRHIRQLRPDCEVAVFDGAHDLLLTHDAEATLTIERFCARL